MDEEILADLERELEMAQDLIVRKNRENQRLRDVADCRLNRIAELERELEDAKDGEEAMSGAYTAIGRAYTEMVAENQRLKEAKAAANHHPNCNYWKWDWDYSWHESDCTCKAALGEGDE